MENILYLFHHIHHKNGRHEVHHCGGEHKKIDSQVDYVIRHCSCGKHSISKKTAIGHATDKKLKPIEITVSFREKCPDGGWHIESGIKN